MCRIIAGVSFVLLVLGLSAGIGKAEDVTYDDSASLQTAPWFALNDSVFPGTPGSPGFNGTTSRSTILPIQIPTMSWAV
jgi:hypothetical protein